jgi:alcohol dehydrogenase YqhD (iron-dependent ADH family)
MAALNGHTLISAAVSNVSSSTDIVAAPGAGKRVVVVSWVLTLDATGEVTWREGTTPISGAMEIAADTPLSGQWLVLQPNTALNLLPTAAANGVVAYYVEQV